MEYWIWLRQVKGLGPIFEKRLLDHFKTPKAIYEVCEEELMSVVGIGEVLAKNIVSSQSLEKAYLMLEDIYKNNIELLTYFDPLYPCIAKEYNKSPTLLYYRGTIKEKIEGVAIVGSRRCSEYGKEVAIKAAEFLAHENIPVISGMAKGIDSYAHTACLKSGGYTIAFLGSGVDICYPTEHIKLMEAIIENGAVISEYPPGTKARPEFFPQRNALISSWSRKILVAEAAEKSGALITVSLAKSQGKKIFAPPHEIYSRTGKGTNKLLYEGANVYLHPSQLISENKTILTEYESLIEPIPSEFDHNSREIIKKKEVLLPTEKKIIDCLMNEVKTIEEIAIELNINQVDLIEHISILELEGRIRSKVGGRYCIAGGKPCRTFDFLRDI